MVYLTLFENSIRNQAIKTALSLLIFGLVDIFYIVITTNKKYPYEHFLGYFNVWATVAVVFGISVIYHGDPNKKITMEDPDFPDYIRDHAYYGALIGLLIFVPLYNWLSSCKHINSFVVAIGNTTWGILLSSITCLIVFLISIQIDTIN